MLSPLKVKQKFLEPNVQRCESQPQSNCSSVGLPPITIVVMSKSMPFLFCGSSPSDHFQRRPAKPHLPFGLLAPLPCFSGTTLKNCEKNDAIKNGSKVASES